MPFNFGLHPAFNCPIEPEKDFFDYHIEFNTPETFRWKVTELNNETVLPLNKDALAETVIITDPKSTVSTLTVGNLSRGRRSDSEISLGGWTHAVTVSTSQQASTIAAPMPRIFFSVMMLPP
jgi:galactose mutarotase-like enzyme